MKAILNSVEDSKLLGNWTGSDSLPTVSGNNDDLKYITPDTLYRLIAGDYDGAIGNFAILDCRYPYEYNGGHIQGSQNISTTDQIVELLQNVASHNNNNRKSVIILHCEFSSKRAPRLCRFLRQKDREINHDNYPALFYPELYVLYGGYRQFYDTYKDKCEPRAYAPMLKKDYESDVRYFRRKSKSWTAGEKKRESKIRLEF